ncbi:hypothetical protein ABZX88_03655 [Kitasatospora aureofaciens]|uniref:hypothetical protein n=1 Tax=Kitasatospora aureofaciens TaxID=1894 RepID=UPI0033B59B15
MTATHRPLPRAAGIAAVLGLLPGALLVTGCTVDHGDPAVPAPSSARTTTRLPSSSPGASKPTDGRVPPGSLGDPADAPSDPPVFGTTGPHTASYSGLGTLSSCASGRRIAALNAPLSDVPDGTRVGATAATGANSEEWLVWAEPDGGLALQALLSSGAPVPQLITTDRAGAVYLRADVTAGDDVTAGTVDVSAQRWQLTDRRPFPGSAATDSTTDGCLRIRTQDGGGCLLDNGSDVPLVVGDCSSRAAWWGAQGLSSHTDD